MAPLENILGVYTETYDDTHPLIGMDEAAKPVVADVEPALPMTPGQPRRVDHHDERKGVRALFLFVDPIRGWRRVNSRDRRPGVDGAPDVRHRLELDYPKAERVTLVCDNLNTHDRASLYAAFNAETANRLARRLRIEHTPRNGSWLNMAEMELSILTRQCIGRRFDSVTPMDEQIAAWQKTRNDQKHGADGRFATADARIKRKGLYPKMKDK